VWRLSSAPAVPANIAVDWITNSETLTVFAAPTCFHESTFLNLPQTKNAPELPSGCSMWQLWCYCEYLNGTHRRQPGDFVRYADVISRHRLNRDGGQHDSSRRRQCGRYPSRPKNAIASMTFSPSVTCTHVSLGGLSFLHGITTDSTEASFVSLITFTSFLSAR